MIKTRIIPAFMAAVLIPGGALAAGAKNEVTDIPFSFEGPFGTYDKHQLQRGLAIYNGICASCHGMKHLAFRDLGRSDGPAMPEDQIKAIAAEFEVADEEGDPGDTRAAKASDLYPANNGAGAPDLSLMAKARAGFHGPFGLGINQFLKGIGGPEYIYSLMVGYVDPPECAPEDFDGYYNVAFASGGFPDECKGDHGEHTVPGSWISMAPPIYEDVAEDYDISYAAFNEDGSLVEAGEGEDDHSGDHDAYHAPEPTPEQMSEDIAAFLMFAAEPALVERKAAGFRNLIMIVILAVLLFYTNKKLWAPVKRKA